MRSGQVVSAAIVAMCLVLNIGCTSPIVPADEATAAVQSYWTALKAGQWPAAYERLHPLIKAKFKLAAFTKVHERRRNSQGFPVDLEIVAAKWSGDDVVVSYVLKFATLDGREPSMPPRPQHVIVRKTCDGWTLLLTHDFLEGRV
jgi:hypothetical protein